MSDFIPNTFQTPNAIIDKLMFLLTDSEFRVLMYMVRHVLGWQKKADTRRAHISLSTFENGFSYETPDGELSYPGCGLGQGTIRKALVALKKYRIAKAVGKPSQKGQQWELAFMTDDNVDIKGLQIRQEEKNQKRKKQTQKARASSPNNQEGVLFNSHTIGGTVQQSQGGTVQQSTTKDHSKDHGKNQNTLARTAHGITDAKIKAPFKEQMTEPFVCSVVSPKPDKPDIKALADAIEKRLNMHNGRQWNIAHMLQGTAKKGEYKQYAQYFVEKPISAERFNRFMDYYESKCPDCELAKAETIADWFGKFEVQEAAAWREFEIQRSRMRLPANIDMLDTGDGDAIHTRQSA
jgi:hypothetical protein